LQTAGKIDVEEEFEQACFHITVYKNYVTTRSHKSTPGQTPSQHAAPAKPGSQLPADLAVGVATQG
jgi:hypothetical protein